MANRIPQEGDWLEGTGWFAAPCAVFGSGLSPEATLTYLVFCCEAGADGGKMPTEDMIADKCGFSAEAARQAVDELIQSGAITRTQTGIALALGMKEARR